MERHVEPSNASALCGPCRKVTVEENLRSEEVARRRHGKSKCPMKFR